MSRGDHLVANGSIGGMPYEHHGIDMGDGSVIHLAPADGLRVTLKDTTGRFAVRRVSFAQFADGRAVRVQQHEPGRPAELIAAAAEAMLGTTGYNVLSNNCEHFATYCATGVSQSLQAEMGTTAVASISSAATKTLWAISGRTGSRMAMGGAVKGALKLHPAALAADGVELAVFAVGCRKGLSPDGSKRVARLSGNVTAIGVGAIVGGPVGAVVGLTIHTSSRAIADRVCDGIRKLIS